VEQLTDLYFEVQAEGTHTRLCTAVCVSA